jgi:hypothetical protein
MIISVDELKEHVKTTKADKVLEDMLQALELSVREYTNNRFYQTPSVRIQADVRGGVFMSESIPFAVGDTVQVTCGDNAADCGIYTIKEITDTTFMVNEDVPDMDSVAVNKVKYPASVKMGVVNMMKWDLENREKVGIQSETISRHSVTYFNMDGDNSMMGYPKSLLGFLRPYKKASRRF